MSFEFAKIALLIFLCIPVLLLSLCLLVNILQENNKIRKKEKEFARSKAAQQRKLQEQRLRRQYFEEEYDRLRGGY